MKTTVELPDDVLREAKVKAARRGIPLRKFFTEAVVEKIAREPLPTDHSMKKEWPVAPPNVPKAELRRIHAEIEADSERLDFDDDE